MPNTQVTIYPPAGAEAIPTRRTSPPRQLNLSPGDPLPRPEEGQTITRPWADIDLPDGSKIELQRPGSAVPTESRKKAIERFEEEPYPWEEGGEWISFGLPDGSRVAPAGGDKKTRILRHVLGSSPAGSVRGETVYEGPRGSRAIERGVREWLSQNGYGEFLNAQTSGRPKTDIHSGDLVQLVHRGADGTVTPIHQGANPSGTALNKAARNYLRGIPEYKEIGDALTTTRTRTHEQQPEPLVQGITGEVSPGNQSKEVTYDLQRPSQRGAELSTQGLSSDEFVTGLAREMIINWTDEGSTHVPRRRSTPEQTAVARERHAETERTVALLMEASLQQRMREQGIVPLDWEKVKITLRGELDELLANSRHVDPATGRRRSPEEAVAFEKKVTKETEKLERQINARVERHYIRMAASLIQQALDADEMALRLAEEAAERPARSIQTKDGEWMTLPDPQDQAPSALEAPGAERRINAGAPQRTRIPGTRDYFANSYEAILAKFQRVEDALNLNPDLQRWFSTVMRNPKSQETFELLTNYPDPQIRSWFMDGFKQALKAAESFDDRAIYLWWKRGKQLPKSRFASNVPITEEEAVRGGLHRYFADNVDYIPTPHGRTTANPDDLGFIAAPERSDPDLYEAGLKAQYSNSKGWKIVRATDVPNLTRLGPRIDRSEYIRNHEFRRLLNSPRSKANEGFTYEGSTFIRTSSDHYEQAGAPFLELSLIHI